MMTPVQLADRWLRTREGTLDLMRHMIQAEEFFREVIVRGARGERWNPWGLAGPGEERLQRARPAILAGASSADYGTTVEACLATWRRVQAETEAALRSLRDEAALEHAIEHPGTGIVAPVWEMCLLMIEHEVHHRGQLSAYLKMLGAEQPALLVR